MKEVILKGYTFDEKSYIRIAIFSRIEKLKSDLANFHPDYYPEDMADKIVSDTTKEIDALCSFYEDLSGQTYEDFVKGYEQFCKEMGE